MMTKNLKHNVPSLDGLGRRRYMGGSRAVPPLTHQYWISSNQVQYNWVGPVLIPFAGATNIFTYNTLLG